MTKQTLKNFALALALLAMTPIRPLTEQTLNNFALSLSLLELALIPSTSLAQVGRASKLPGKNPATAAAQAASHQARTQGSPSYTYTLLSFPGSLDTLAEGITLGATTSKMEIAGGSGPVGFSARMPGKKVVAETYETVNYPHSSAPQTVNGINDSGQMVGGYEDYDQDYELSDGKFTTIAVPFAGALATFPCAINDSSEIVGGWWDSNKIEHSFTLIGGTYTSFDCPGTSGPGAFGISSAGDIVGQYIDASGAYYGFVLSGGSCTWFNFPGAVITVPTQSTTLATSLACTAPPPNASRPMKAHRGFC
jgi:hypothetical protein